MISAWPSAWIAAALLCAPAAMANVNTGNMLDLGYPEPDWYPIRQGSASAPAVTYNVTTTFWGNIEPYSTANASLCKWVNTVENGGRGICQTDISWIHASVGLSKSVFSDPVVNYILRFHLEGACYRSTQYSDNDAAQYCAPWWWDAATNTKVPTNQTCYEITQEVIDQFSGQPVLRKWGCAHKAPFGGPVDSNDTVLAPPDDGSSNFTTVGVTASPPGTFQPVDTSLPPATPVAIPSAAPTAPVDPNATVPATNATVPVANVTEPVAVPVVAPVANATEPAVAPIAPAGNVTAPVAPDANATVPVVVEAPATAPVAPVAPTAIDPEVAAVAPVAPAGNTSTETVTVEEADTPAPTNLSATATVPTAAPVAPAQATVGGRRRLQQNNLALPDVNGTGNANTTATPAAPAANETTAAPNVTTAPATVPTAAPAAPAAAPLGFPTAAEDPSVQTTTAVSQGNVIATQEDFVKLLEVYNADGLEGWPTRQQWYACQDFTAPFSVGRETCYREAFGKNFGLNAVVLRSMLQVMRFDIANCYGNFATNGAQQGAKSSKEWCEVDTASWIVTNTLPQNNITGTPAQPMSLDPTVTAPPPPPPPPPPFPPPPMVEPLQLLAVDDPFAPDTPAGSGAGGITAPQTSPETAPGDRGVVEDEGAAYGLSSAASMIFGAAAAMALLL